MTKIPSVEKEIEYLRFAMRGGCNCKGCEDDRANIGGHCVIRQALTAQRTALLTELRNSELLEEKVEHQDWCKLTGELEYSSCGCWKDHNTLARAIKARLDELIKSNSV